MPIPEKGLLKALRMKKEWEVFPLVACVISTDSGQLRIGQA